MSFLGNYSLTFYVHNSFKIHYNSRTDIFPITFQNTSQKIGKNIRIYTFLKWIRRRRTEKKQHCDYSPLRQVEMV